MVAPVSHKWTFTLIWKGNSLSSEENSCSLRQQLYWLALSSSSSSSSWADVHSCKRKVTVIALETNYNCFGLSKCKRIAKRQLPAKYASCRQNFPAKKVATTSCTFGQRSFDKAQRAVLPTALGASHLVWATSILFNFQLAAWFLSYNTDLCPSLLEPQYNKVSGNIIIHVSFGPCSIHFTITRVKNITLMP